MGADEQRVALSPVPDHPVIQSIAASLLGVAATRVRFEPLGSHPHVQIAEDALPTNEGHERTTRRNPREIFEPLLRPRESRQPRYPLGTLILDLSGALVIGFVPAFVVHRPRIPM
jgi:hypothetical protein